MLQQIDFEKYQKMSERQKFNALLKEKKDIEALQEKIKFKKSVVGYLQGELNFFLEEAFNEKLDSAVEQVKKGQTYKCKSGSEMLEIARRDDEIRD